MHRGATYRARRRVRGRKAAQEAKGLRKGALPDKMTGTDTPRHTPGPGRRTGDAGLAWVDIGQTLGGIQHPARHARAQRVRGRGAGLSGGAHQVWERPSGEQGAAFVFRRSQTTLLEVGRSSSQSAFRIASLAVGMGEEGRTMVPDGEAQLRAALPLETRGQRTLARTRSAHVR